MTLQNVRILIVTAVIPLAACGGGGGPAGADVGERCFDSSECASGICDALACTQPCSTDAECEALGVSLDLCGADGLCVEPCIGERRPSGSEQVCIGGREVSCATLDASYCDVCDGMCPGQRCAPMVGCQPLADLGEPCAEDSDCRTANCSRIAGVCRVPLEAACDATNCDRCVTLGTWSYCSRECGTDIDTPCAGGEWDRCRGTSSYNEFWCRPACGSGCPGSCEYASDGESYCREDFGADWSMSSPPRAELQPCRYDEHCTEGVCLSAPSCDSRVPECYGRRGFCSGGCSSDSDCGTEGRCVTVPCVDGATAGCGNVCLPACESTGDCNPLAEAACRELPAVAGGGASVCDPRNADGERCSSGSQCVSGSCASTGRCAAAGGAPNGSTCAAVTDCASGNCQGGTCRGTSLRGDPCATSFDCSVGTCVSGVCD